MRKQLTDYQIRELDKLTTRALQDIIEAWEIAVTGMPVKSKDFRHLCRAGRDLQRFNLVNKSIAEARGVEVSSIKTVCGFG